MKFINRKKLRRNILLYVCVCLLIILVPGWMTLSVATAATPVPQKVCIILLIVLATTVALYLVGKIRDALRWFENALDNFPLPVVIMDQNMGNCYENKAASKSVQHDFYKTTPLFREIPEGFAITKRVAFRTQLMGMEYNVTLAPALKNEAIVGYIIIFQNIHALVEDSKTRNQLMEEMNLLLKTLDGISADFSNSAAALAHCVQQQARSLGTVLSVINGAVASHTVETEDLQQLREAVVIINSSVKEGNIYAKEISHTAGDIVGASHQVSNTIKSMRNIMS